MLDDVERVQREKNLLYVGCVGAASCSMKKMDNWMVKGKKVKVWGMFDLFFGVYNWGDKARREDIKSVQEFNTMVNRARKYRGKRG